MTTLEKRVAELERVFRALPEGKRGVLARIIRAIIPMAEREGAETIITEDVIDAILGVLSAIVPKIAFKGTARVGVLMSSAIANYAPELASFLRQISDVANGSSPPDSVPAASP